MRCAWLRVSTGRGIAAASCHRLVHRDTVSGQNARLLLILILLPDSVFSKYPDSDALTSDSLTVTDGPSFEAVQPTSLVQTLGSASLVTKQTEVLSLPRGNKPDTEGAVTEVVISTLNNPEVLGTPSGFLPLS